MYYFRVLLYCVFVSNSFALPPRVRVEKTANPILCEILPSRDSTTQALSAALSKEKRQQRVVHGLIVFVNKVSEDGMKS